MDHVAGPETTQSEADRPPVGPGREQLRSLERSVRECAGAEAADRILFEAGASLARRMAEELGPQGGARERFEHGLARFAELGLGRARIDSFTVGPGHLAVDGEVERPFEGEIERCSRGRPAHAATGLTAGFLGALAGAVSGLDMTCSPIGCTRCLGPASCRFELRPAHDFAQLDGPRHAPPGSARFFLGAVGRSLSGAEVSLDDLLETTIDAVVLIDNDDVVRYWNRGAQRMFQFEASEVVGRKIGRIVPPDLIESDELGQVRRKLDRGETVVNYITRRIRKDGVELWCSMSRTPLHDSQGRVVGSTAILRDITEQRRTEIELARSRTLATVGEMSAKIAHEIKNPLAGIYAAVQVLARELPPGDPRREIFDEIGEEVRRLDQTVIDMLRFARPVPPKPRPTSLRSVVRDVVDPLRRVFPALSIVLEIDEFLVLPIDERMLSQVFENLVLNALQATEGKGTRVIIAAYREQTELRVEVRDDGPGVPLSARDEIFEPFVTTKTRGTGLGLPIARKNVEAHGGTLSVGDAPEGGACFTLRLPLRGNDTA